MGRHFHDNSNMLVALAIVLDILPNTFTVDRKTFPDCVPAGNFHLDLPVERRNIDFRAQSCFSKVDGDLTNNLIEVSHGERSGLWLSLNDNVQMAGLSTIGSQFTFAPELKP